MRRFWAGLVVLGLVPLTGCPSKTTSAKVNANKGGLKLTASPEEVKLVRDAPHKVEITVARPDGFTEEVKLAVKVSAPSGKKKESVTATISPETLKPGGDGKATLTVTAAENAGEGEYKATVEAMPGSGAPARLDVKLTVPKP